MSEETERGEEPSAAVKRAHVHSTRPGAEARTHFLILYAKFALRVRPGDER